MTDSVSEKWMGVSKVEMMVVDLVADSVAVTVAAWIDEKVKRLADS